MKTLSFLLLVVLSQSIFAGKPCKYSTQCDSGQTCSKHENTTNGTCTND